MTSRLNRSWTLLALAALTAAALAGCGKQGELERPAPLFGHVKTPSAQVLARDQAAARARADGLAAAGPQVLAPLSVDEVRNQRVPTKTPPSDAAAPQGQPSPPQGRQ